ncbi:MAG: tRNA-dihydrouridine synthase [bacterium]|nr:tRNA-dihydrouridine synthase [bacterium]
MSFWKQSEPLLLLAPMYDVSDTAFRQMVARYSSPSAMFTEFVSVHGLTSKAAHKLERELFFSKLERPIIAQIYGIDPALFEKTAKRLVDIGFDGIDINMGCPVNKVLKSGSCSALIETPTLAQDIVRATKAGAGDVPVSIKTRIGLNEIVTERWITQLLDVEPVAITVHGRTSRELSKVPCHFDEIGKAAALAKGTGIKIVANGDIKTIDEAHSLIDTYALGGAMFGRAAFGNPWIFTGYIPTVKERLRACVEHTYLFEEYFGINSAHLLQHKWPPKNFNIMKKHYKAYCSGFDGAKELRVALMETRGALEVKQLVDAFLEKKETLHDIRVGLPESLPFNKG